MTLHSTPAARTATGTTIGPDGRAAFVREDSSIVSPMPMMGSYTALSLNFGKRKMKIADPP